MIDDLHIRLLLDRCIRAGVKRVLQRRPSRRVGGAATRRSSACAIILAASVSVVDLRISRSP